jgi:hypothetical protein
MLQALAAYTSSMAGRRSLPQADAASGMLTYADVCLRMLTYAQLC